MSDITIHTDGAARGNPGPASIAYIINTGDEEIEFFQSIGNTTNNQAEYRAMRAATERLVELGPREKTLIFHSDSELMVKQLCGEYRVKDANIRPLFNSIEANLGKLRANQNTVVLKAVRREYNKRADALANLALDR